MNRQPATSNRKPATGTTAVVVNDDPTQLNVLSGLLRKGGFNTTVFESAEVALSEMGSACPPDLIVTDLYMPGIDGWRFCRLLRSPDYASFNRSPIMVVSATFAGEEASRITVDLGADAFLSSPVDGKRFVETAESLIRGERPTRRPGVLIVEDSKTLAGVIKKIFEANGYRAEAALTGLEALKSFDAGISGEPFDVAVIDYHLPDIQGDELLKAFRLKRPDTVCVMITSDTRPDLALEWLKKGAAAYARKPFSPAYLVELCTGACRERALLRVEDLLEERTRELRASEERYREVFASIPDGALVHDTDGVILDANETMAGRLDVPRKDLVGRNVAEFVEPENAAGIKANITEVLSGKSLVFETTYVSASGRTTPAEVHERSLSWGDGDQALFSISRDITERFELDQRKQQIAKAESLSLMAGALAHHFNNMLSIVIGNLELTMNDLTAGSPNQEHLSEAMEGARRAAEISTIMLTFAGQLQKKTGVRDLADITNGIVSELRQTFPRRIRLQNELSVSSRLFVNIDIDLIRQALAHLVTNALEAIGEDSGEIRVSIGTMQGEEISRTPAWPPDWKPGTGAYAVIEVSDTGEGIPAHNTGKVMDPFFSTKFTGRGIGLPVVSGIARVHGGGIQFQSKPGSGSVFRMLFPLMDKKTQADRKTATESFVSSKTDGLVLLVEDEEMVRNMMGAILRRLGFDVLAAKDGVEALEIFRRRPDEIRLVITDLTMTGMSGWNTIAALRKIRPDIPVILASGYDEAHVMAPDHAEKAQAFLHKPFEIETLRKTLERVLGLDRLHGF